MAIKKYFEDGKEYWKVYVHVRSKTKKKLRLQKNVKRLKSEAEATREEKKIIKELSIAINKAEGHGLSWEDVFYRWWEDLKLCKFSSLSERCAMEYLSTLKKWTRHWSNIPASQLTKADGREFIQKLESANLTKAYQKKVRNIVNKVYEWGIENRLIHGVLQSPLKGFYIEKAQEKAPDILTLDEIKKFLSAAQVLNHPWYPVWAFAVLTGMRSGELQALKWSQIDLEKEVILVDQSYDSVSKSTGPTKGRYWRTIPINLSLKQLILDLKNIENANGEYVLPRSKTWDNGDQAVPLKLFLKSIGVKPIKFHALRACFATQMLANGVPAPIVMKIGGWKKSATMDIYLRMAGVDTKGATECLKFVPDKIDYSSNVIRLFDANK